MTIAKIGLFWFLNLWLAHPLHVSVTQIDHNAQAQTLEITHKIFIDDLEATLEKAYGVKCRIGTPQENAQTDELIARYLSQNYAMWVNGKAVNPQWVGKETDLEAVWVYREVPQVKAVKKLSIKNTTLCDRFTDQRNLVHCKVGGKTKSLNLDQNNSQQELVFQ